MAELATRDMDRYDDVVEDLDYEIYSRSPYTSCSHQGLGNVLILASIQYIRDLSNASIPPSIQSKQVLATPRTSLWVASAAVPDPAAVQARAVATGSAKQVIPVVGITAAGLLTLAATQMEPHTLGKQTCALHIKNTTFQTIHCKNIS